MAVHYHVKEESWGEGACPVQLVQKVGHEGGVAKGGPFLDVRGVKVLGEKEDRVLDAALPTDCQHCPTLTALLWK